MSKLVRPRLSYLGHNLHPALFLSSFASHGVARVIADPRNQEYSTCTLRQLLILSIRMFCCSIHLRHRLREVRRSEDFHEDWCRLSAARTDAIAHSDTLIYLLKITVDGVCIFAFRVGGWKAIRSAYRKTAEGAPAFRTWRENDLWRISAKKAKKERGRLEFRPR